MWIASSLTLGLVMSICIYHPREWWIYPHGSVIGLVLGSETQGLHEFVFGDAGAYGHCHNTVNSNK